MYDLYITWNDSTVYLKTDTMLKHNPFVIKNTVRLIVREKINK